MFESLPFPKIDIGDAETAQDKLSLLALKILKDTDPQLLTNVLEIATDTSDKEAQALIRLLGVYQKRRDLNKPMQSILNNLKRTVADIKSTILDRTTLQDYVTQLENAICPGRQGAALPRDVLHTLKEEFARLDPAQFRSMVSEILTELEFEDVQDECIHPSRVWGIVEPAAKRQKKAGYRLRYASAAGAQTRPKYSLGIPRSPRVWNILAMKN